MNHATLQAFRDIAATMLTQPKEQKMSKQLTVGSRVEGGDTPEDYDTGIVRHVDGNQITVAWDSSKQTTTQHESALRLESIRAIGTGMRNLIKAMENPLPRE